MYTGPMECRACKKDATRRCSPARDKAAPDASSKHYLVHPTHWLIYAQAAKALAKAAKKKGKK